MLKALKMPEGSKPMGVALSPDGKRLYVANGRGGTVSRDRSRHRLGGRPARRWEPRPWGIALTPDGRKLYAANGPSNDVSVVDADELQVDKTIRSASSPGASASAEAP